MGRSLSGFKIPRFIDVRDLGSDRLPQGADDATLRAMIEGAGTKLQ